MAEPDPSPYLTFLAGGLRFRSERDVQEILERYSSAIKAALGDLTHEEVILVVPFASAEPLGLSLGTPAQLHAYSSGKGALTELLESFDQSRHLFRTHQFGGGQMPLYGYAGSWLERPPSGIVYPKSYYAYYGRGTQQESYYTALVRRRAPAGQDWFRVGLLRGSLDIPLSYPSYESKEYEVWLAGRGSARKSTSGNVVVRKVEATQEVLDAAITSFAAVLEAQVSELLDKQRGIAESLNGFSADLRESADWARRFMAGDEQPREQPS